MQAEGGTLALLKSASLVVCLFCISFVSKRHISAQDPHKKAIAMIALIYGTSCSGFMLNSLITFCQPRETNAFTIQIRTLAIYNRSNIKGSNSNDIRRGSCCQNMVPKDIRERSFIEKGQIDNNVPKKQKSINTKKSHDGHKQRVRSNKHNQNYHISDKYKIKSMFHQAKEMERTGQWCKACEQLESILKIDPFDSYSHLALARLQSRRERCALSETSSTHSNHLDAGKVMTDVTFMDIVQSTPFSKAREAFYNGTQNCADSIHIWQAWALHEESVGNTSYARYLFQKALDIDGTNPYVCHGYGLLEHRLGNFDAAMNLWERPLKSGEKGKITAALVCSVGKQMIAQGRFVEARSFYMDHVVQMNTQREAAEVYLAVAWLEEKHFHNFSRAEELLNSALQVSPENSRALAALARLAGRKVDSENLSLNRDSSYLSSESFHISDIERRRNDAVKRRLKVACNNVVRKYDKETRREWSEVTDGRLFNAWAKLEVEDMNFDAARKILSQGMKVFPHDYSLRQAAGKVEEHVGNYTGARHWYTESLLVAPSAPTLVAYVLLEINHPIAGNEFNYTKVCRLFDEALLLDPRHGPLYNAYGNMELKMGNIEKARQIYQNGILANCRDVASVFHGLAMLELSLGNVETARRILIDGLEQVQIQDSGMDSNRRKRAIFLAQSLGMLELNCNRAAEAKAIFERGIEQHGNSTQLLLGAALSEVKLGNEDLARILFERSVNVDRKHAQAWQSWGVMEMRSGHYNVAKILFECGIKNDHTHGALWQAYATMESRRGNIEIARALFAAGVLKCPEHVPLYQAWACLELRSGSFNQARTLIGEALTRKKSQGSSWLVAAKIEERLGNKGLVSLILQRGLEHAPHSAELHRALAEYEMNRGKIDIARKLLEKGLEVDPMHAPSYHSLAELEARVFNIEGLSKLNKRAAEVFNTNALEPTSVSMAILGNKLRKNSLSHGKIPTSVSTLANMIVADLDIEEEISDLDPDLLIEKLSQDEKDVLDPKKI
mmetsp:Transcript_9433/g.17760  ORF Transcript_9433/g.17760 Transcript_9433/m.17760 type:complete len:1012 (+) Transcript_9433:154-3189(+)